MQGALRKLWKGLQTIAIVAVYNTYSIREARSPQDCKCNSNSTKKCANDLSQGSTFSYARKAKGME